jgi:hypothetical protein
MTTEMEWTEGETVEYIVTIGLAIVVMVAGTGAAVLIRWRRKLTPYVLHRRRYERSGEIAELDAMKESYRKEN